MHLYAEQVLWLYPLKLANWIPGIDREVVKAYSYYPPCSAFLVNSCTQRN
jgi:hypothetical protein